MYTKKALKNLDKLLWSKNINNTGLIKMTKEESVEIDVPLDFEFVDHLMKKKNEKNPFDHAPISNTIPVEKVIKIEKHKVSNFGKPFIIAEIGSNHNGDIELAKKLIDAAKECGVDCVKFQLFDFSTFSNMCYEDNPKARKKLAERDPMMKKLFEQEHPKLKQDHIKYILSKEQIKEIKEYCDKKEIILLCTPIYKQAVDFL